MKGHLPALLVAVVIPWCMAYTVSPSTTALNQIAAIIGWSTLVLAGLRLRGGQRTNTHASSSSKELLAALAAMAALGLVALPALVSWLQGRQSGSIIASAVSCVACAALVFKAGTHQSALQPPGGLMPSLFFAILVGSLASALVALVQVFASSWPDGSWVAQSSVAGRAVGNLRQANHLSSLLLWGALAVIGLREISFQSWTVGEVHRGHKPLDQPQRSILAVQPVLSALALALMVFGVVLTASRTGMVGVGLLCLWGIADRRLSRGSRWMLLATPVVYAAAWWGMAWWAQAPEHVFGGQQRMAEGDISGSRFRIWADTLQLIAAHPWAGVGWGNFNFAWSLTPFPNRHSAFFDHTHNLPLQLAVELGVPMALLICGLLLWALWRAWTNALRAEPVASAAGRCAVMMILLIGLHSLLEYPLWYSYFLLPTAFVWGFALGLPVAQHTNGEVSTAADSPTTQNASLIARPPAKFRSGMGAWLMAMTGALCMAGAVYSVFDYLRVAEIFASRAGAAPLEQRIASGKRSVFFAHHAHYAAATVSDTPGQEMASFDAATHHLLDTRLMMAWAQAFAEVGDLERARYLAERLREFRNPASADFFAECDRAREAGLPVAQWPFQCQPPSRALSWQDFLPETRARQAGQ